MITFESILLRVPALDAPTLEAWIAQDWVRPERTGDRPVFDEADVARCRLILELREEMEVNDAAIPVVLHLLDQLHRTRRQLRVVAEAVERLRGGA